MNVANCILNYPASVKLFLRRCQLEVRKSPVPLFWSVSSKKKKQNTQKPQNTLAKIAWVKGLLLGELSPAFQDREYKYTLVIIFSITGVSVLPEGVVECFMRYFLPSFSSRKCVIFFPTVFCLFSFIPRKLFFSNCNN